MTANETATAPTSTQTPTPTPRKVKCDICFEFADRPHRCGKECRGLYCEECLGMHLEHNSNCPCCRRRLVSIWRRNRAQLFDADLHQHIQQLIASGFVGFA